MAAIDRRTSQKRKVFKLSPLRICLVFNVNRFSKPQGPDRSLLGHVDGIFDRHELSLFTLPRESQIAAGNVGLGQKHPRPVSRLLIIANLGGTHIIWKY